MDFEQIQAEIRKLDESVGKESAESIIKLMDLKANSFEQKIDLLSKQIASTRNLIAVVGLIIALATIASQFIK